MQCLLADVHLQGNHFPDSKHFVCERGNQGADDDTETLRSASRNCALTANNVLGYALAAVPGSRSLPFGRESTRIGFVLPFIVPAARHVANCLPSYLEIRRDFPLGFFPKSPAIAVAFRNCCCRNAEDKFYAEKICSGFVRCPLGILLRDLGPRGLRNPLGSWEKLHIYLFSADPKTIKTPTTRLAHCALPTTILFFHRSFVDLRRP